MFVEKILCLLLVALFIMIVYKIDDDSLNKLCSYFRNNEVENISNFSGKRIRSINELLSQVNQKDRDFLYRGRLEWEATALELEALKNFRLGILTIDEVTPILNNVIKSAQVYGNDRPIHSLRNNLMIIKDITLAILMVLYMFRRLRNVTWNFWSIFSRVIEVQLIVTILVTWWELSQGKTIEAIPQECQPDKMGWTDKIVELITSNCEKRYEPKRKINPSDVTLDLAFLHTFHKISLKVGSILFKIRADYLAWIYLWTIQPIVDLKEYSLVVFISLILALYCCCYHCSEYFVLLWHLWRFRLRHTTRRR